jgi:hypothetical protein
MIILYWATLVMLVSANFLSPELYSTPRFDPGLDSRQELQLARRARAVDLSKSSLVVSNQLLTNCE